MSQRSEARGEMHRSGVEQRLGGEGGADSGPGLQRDEWGAGGGVERARSRAGWAKLGCFVCWAAGRERKGAGLGWWASGMGFGLG